MRSDPGFKWAIMKQGSLSCSLNFCETLSSSCRHIPMWSSSCLTPQWSLLCEWLESCPLGPQARRIWWGCWGLSMFLFLVAKSTLLVGLWWFLCWSFAMASGCVTAYPQIMGGEITAMTCHLGEPQSTLETPANQIIFQPFERIMAFSGFQSVVEVISFSWK